MNWTPLSPTDRFKDPADRKRLLTLGADGYRNLVGCTANTFGPNFNCRLHIFNRRNENVERIFANLAGDPLHHGMLAARTHGLDVVVVHLRPHAGRAIKQAECQRALAALRERAGLQRKGQAPGLILGDFNCIHRQDVARYSHEALERYRKWKWPLTEGSPSEFALAPLLEAGLLELVTATGSVPATIPLPRVDFAFATPSLAEYCRAAHWHWDPHLLRHSDHPPVVVDLQWPVTPK